MYCRSFIKKRVTPLLLLYSSTLAKIYIFTETWFYSRLIVLQEKGFN